MKKTTQCHIRRLDSVHVMLNHHRGNEGRIQSFISSGHLYVQGVQLWSEMNVRFVDIGKVDDHHC